MTTTSTTVKTAPAGGATPVTATGSFIRRSADRGHANHGWLESFHTFSFADYHDPRWMGFHSLRVINDDLILPGMGFGTPPHRDMEIITYILRGSLQHKDSMGNGRIIRPGDIQYMAAGTGVMHSEFNPSADEATHLLQIWIQPNRRGVTPRYEERSFSTAATGVLHQVAGPTGDGGSIQIHQDAELWLARLEPGQTVTHAVGAGRHAWLHVAEGEVRVGDTTLHGGDALAVSEPGILSIQATAAAQLLLFHLA